MAENGKVPTTLTEKGVGRPEYYTRKGHEKTPDPFRKRPPGAPGKTFAPVPSGARGKRPTGSSASH